MWYDMFFPERDFNIERWLNFQTSEAYNNRKYVQKNT